jgi:hypothetical protein
VTLLVLALGGFLLAGVVSGVGFATGTSTTETTMTTGVQKEPTTGTQRTRLAFEGRAPSQG